MLHAMNTNENPPQANVRLNRIKAVSKVLRTILFAVMIIQAAGLLALVIVVPGAIIAKLKPESVFNNFDACALLPFAFMVTLNFFRFFNRLKDGHLFDSQTVRHLEIAGKWWIVLGVIQIIFQALKAYIFTPNNIIVSADGIIAGLTVFFVAWLLQEAQKLQEEQELTV
jgi:hypothetical protein